jgi:hypothetical protein
MSAPTNETRYQAVTDGDPDMRRGKIHTERLATWLQETCGLRPRPY